MSARPAAELLREPDALLSRSHLRELGLERRAVDAVFRAGDVIVLPGYSRPLIRVADYLKLLERSTHDGRASVRSITARTRECADWAREGKTTFPLFGPAA